MPKKKQKRFRVKGTFWLYHKDGKIYRIEKKEKGKKKEIVFDNVKCDKRVQADNELNAFHLATQRTHYGLTRRYGKEKMKDTILIVKVCLEAEEIKQEQTAE